MTAFSFVLLRIGDALGWHYLASVTLSWIVPLSLSFALHKRFTFRHGGEASFGMFWRHIAGGVLQWLIVCLGYIVTVDVLGLDLTTSFVLNSLLAAAVSFTFMRLAVFRRGRETPDELVETPGSRI